MKKSKEQIQNIIKPLIDAKAEISNTIDLNAYALGAFDALNYYYNLKMPYQEKEKIMKTNRFKIKEIDNEIYIGDQLITDEAQEETGWEIRDLQEFIYNLINLTAEADRDRQIMTSDLKYLIRFADEHIDEFILSSNSTNEYILYSQNPIQFHEKIEELKQF